jgi:uncharacterized membrane protein YcaP (DUF421 family)
MLFDDWESFWRVPLMGVVTYLALIIFLRLSGKRTLAKMNAFDLVVTVALGSTLAAILLTPEVVLFEGLAALFLLIALQYVIATLSVRFRWVANVAKSDARILLTDGVANDKALRQERVTHEELRTAVRNAGHGDLAEIAAVILETDGSFSVVPMARAGSRSALPGQTQRPT